MLWIHLSLSVVKWMWFLHWILDLISKIVECFKAELLLGYFGHLLKFSLDGERLSRVTEQFTDYLALEVCVLIQCSNLVILEDPLLTYVTLMLFLVLLHCLLMESLLLAFPWPLFMFSINAVIGAARGIRIALSCHGALTSSGKPLDWRHPGVIPLSWVWKYTVIWSLWASQRIPATFDHRFLI